VQRGDLGPEPARQALIAYGETVGTLAYARGRATRTSDARLLEDLARQLGGVLHARNLVSALQQTRERLVLTREEERRRLRRDLHDGVGPALAGLILKVDTIGNVLPAHADAQPARDRLRLLREDVQATVLDVRRVVEGLRPPALDELGLAVALRQATARLAADVRLAVAVHVPEALPPLPAAVEVAAFRIAVEATTNVVRHAGATSCTITLTAAPTRLLVTITDNGRGLDTPADGRNVAAAGNGMATMRERAEELGGTVTVTSVVGDGTVIAAEMPLGIGAPAMAGAVVVRTAEGLVR
jgi:signal transduction histidine kinase